jgi:hypothetical protein
MNAPDVLYYTYISIAIQSDYHNDMNVTNNNSTLLVCLQLFELRSQVILMLTKCVEICSYLEWKICVFVFLPHL